RGPSSRHARRSGSAAPPKRPCGARRRAATAGCRRARRAWVSKRRSATSARIARRRATGRPSRSARTASDSTSVHPASTSVPMVGQYSHDPFETLISCLLSLRTQDATTDAASARLFALARTPPAMRRLPRRTIERAIFPVGFYRTKARTILEVSRAIVEEHAGKVPSDLDRLLELKGVGRKTASLVITLALRKHGICVDTHVHRIS